MNRIEITQTIRENVIANTPKAEPKVKFIDSGRRVMTADNTYEVYNLGATGVLTADLETFFPYEDFQA
jgi:hypothetical protein